MKLALVALVAAATMAAAAEADDQTEGVMVNICGDDLFAALQEACTKQSVDYLLKYGTIHDKHNHKHLHIDHYRRDHDHAHDFNHNHDHDHLDNHSQAENNDGETISQKCCHKPCLVKDFVAFCEKE